MSYLLKGKQSWDDSQYLSYQPAAVYCREGVRSHTILNSRGMGGIPASTHPHDFPHCSVEENSDIGNHCQLTQELLHKGLLGIRYKCKADLTLKVLYNLSIHEKRGRLQNVGVFWVETAIENMGIT